MISARSAGLLLGAGLLVAGGVWLNRCGMIDADSLSNAIAGLGIWAIPVFVILFGIGGLLGVPGLVFTIAARLAFGPIWGFVAAYAGALLTVTTAFAIVRVLRGGDAEPPRLPFRWAQRILDGAESRPVLSVVVLRLIFFVSPPLNYGLGFSGLRTRDYVLGSAIGLAIPTFVVTSAVGLF